MTWIVGIDEAGYGPNLGPFLMTAVACRVPDACRDADLWHLLRSGVYRGTEASDERLLIDDSKRVYTARGLAGLEHGVLAVLGRIHSAMPATLAELIDWVCPDDGDELRREVWYRGFQTLPVHLAVGELEACAARFAEVCTAAVIGDWQVRSVAVCPARFNALLDERGTKSHVLGHALTYLLRWQRAHLPGADDVVFLIDKHGSRNSYAAMIQHALPDGVVFTVQEGLARSAYHVHGLEREARLLFQPRADGEHFCVALASMTSKYLREVLMLEFNRFWREHLPDLKPTAGYPGDAARFLQAIRQTIEKLGLREECIWRRK
jgi:ribonuclease HII